MQRLLDNRYRIIRTIASGGCGQTFLAEDTRLPSQRKCVIKQLKPATLNSDSYGIIKERFEREAAILEMASRHSSQIPTLHAYFSEDNEFYLVQDWIEGKNLEELVTQHGCYSDQKAVHTLVSILKVLAVVHSANIIHRDLKPNNIMVREKDQLPMVIDFGAVKEVVTTGTDDTTSIVIGALPFMPPEQRLGRPAFASDIYSLGLTGIFMVSGKMPQHWQIEGAAHNAWQQFAPHISSRLANVLNQAIEPDLARRLPSAAAMMQALQALDLNKTMPVPLPLPGPPPKPETTKGRGWLGFGAGTLFTGLVMGLALIVMYAYFASQQEKIQANANAQITSERSRREALERDTANINSIKQQAEEAATIKQALTSGNIWRVVQIHNDTNTSLTYSVRNPDGSWSQETLEPGKTIAHWQQSLAIVVKFDYSFDEGYQEKIHHLLGIPIIGHEPTETEKNQAAIFNFQTKSNNEIDLYNQGTP